MPPADSLRKLAPILLALGAVGVALPFILPDYLMTSLILFFVWAVVAQSWNLVWGVAGVWSLGQMAIFAMAGYCTGWLIIHTEISPFLAAIIGVIAAVAASLMMALPSIRLKGVYVILMTISFHEIFRILLTTDTSGFTGGIFGLPHYQGFVSDELKFLGEDADSVLYRPGDVPDRHRRGVAGAAFAPGAGVQGDRPGPALRGKPRYQPVSHPGAGVHLRRRAGRRRRCVLGRNISAPCSRRC